MPEAVIPTTVQFEPDAYTEVKAFKDQHRLVSFSKALMAMLAERKTLLAQVGRG